MASKAQESAAAYVETKKITVDGQEYTEVKEGLGRILIPDRKSVV